jgi:hypothetical protein
MEEPGRSSLSAVESAVAAAPDANTFYYDPSQGYVPYSGTQNFAGGESNIKPGNINDEYGLPTSAAQQELLNTNSEMVETPTDTSGSSIQPLDIPEPGVDQTANIQELPQGGDGSGGHVGDDIIPGLGKDFTVVNDLGYNPSYPYGSSGSGVPTQKFGGVGGNLLGGVVGNLLLPGLGGLVGSKLGGIGGRMFTRWLQQQHGGDGGQGGGDGGGLSAFFGGQGDFSGRGLPEGMGPTGPLNEGIEASLGQSSSAGLPQGLYQGLGNPVQPVGGINIGNLGGSGGNLGSIGGDVAFHTAQPFLGGQTWAQVAKDPSSSFYGFSLSGSPGGAVSGNRNLLSAKAKGDADVEPKLAGTGHDFAEQKALWDRIQSALWNTQMPTDILGPVPEKSDENEEPQMAKKGKTKIVAAQGFGPRHANNAKEGTSTDTVPAMLTPREAVLNRNAAELAGRGNIQQLNSQGNQLADEGVDLAARGQSAVPSFLPKAGGSGASDYLKYVPFKELRTADRALTAGPRMGGVGLRGYAGGDDDLNVTRRPTLEETSSGTQGSPEIQKVLGPLFDDFMTYMQDVHQYGQSPSGGISTPGEYKRYLTNQNVMQGLKLQKGTSDMKKRKYQSGTGAVDPLSMYQSKLGANTPTAGGIPSPMPIPTGNMPPGTDKWNPNPGPGPMPVNTVPLIVRTAPTPMAAPTAPPPRPTGGSFYPQKLPPPAPISGYQSGGSDVTPIGGDNPKDHVAWQDAQYAAPHIDIAALKSAAQANKLDPSTVSNVLKTLQGIGAFSGSGAGGAPGGGGLPYDALGGQYASFSGGSAPGYSGGISDIGYAPEVGPDMVYHGDKGGWIGPFDPRWTFQRYWRGTGNVNPLGGLGAVMSAPRAPHARQPFPPGRQHPAMPPVF